MKQLEVKNSSNIHWARYDEATRTLEIDFKNSKGEKVSTYAYPEFAPEEWDRFQIADSKGQHFAYHIRPKHKGIRVAQKE